MTLPFPPALLFHSQQNGGASFRAIARSNMTPAAAGARVGDMAMSRMGRPDWQQTSDLKVLYHVLTPSDMNAVVNASDALPAVYYSSVRRVSSVGSVNSGGSLAGFTKAPSFLGIIGFCASVQQVSCVVRTGVNFASSIAFDDRARYIAGSNQYAIVDYMLPARNYLNGQKLFGSGAGSGANETDDIYILSSS